MKTREIINSNNEDSSEPFAVAQHIILRNMWEYYVTESSDGDGVMWALVVGDYTEYGTVSHYDIDKHGISYTTDLTDLLPPPEWQWCDEPATV